MVDEQAVQDFVRDLFAIERPDHVMLHPRQVADMVGSRRETFQAAERRMFDAFRVPIYLPPFTRGKSNSSIFALLHGMGLASRQPARDPRHGIGLLALVVNAPTPTFSRDKMSN